jgi:ADP-heptose:LPS heptosyltransferase
MDESKTIEGWNKTFKHVVSIGNDAKLSDELKMIKTLDLMVTMDSANMHLASNMNVPVVSVWGPTHPYAGFYGFRQDPSNAVQINLSCRPCSVYGNKTCWREDHACMNEIKPELIISKIEEQLN